MKAILIFILSSSLAVPMLKGDAEWERHCANQGLDCFVYEIQELA